MKIPTKLVSAAAVAAVTLMAAGCGGSTTPVETFAEAEDPVAADSTAWDGVRKGLNAMWGSTDCLYSRSVPPASQDAPKSIRLTAWRGERVSAQAVLWSVDGAQSVVCATDDFTSDGATLPAGIATARFVRYTIADKSDPKCICPRPQNHPAVLQPDMLDSLDRFDMAACTTRPVWITVNVPADAPAGIYRSQITVTRGDGCGKIRLPFELEVQDHLLPPPTEWRYHLDLWQHPAAVARAEGVELWSDAHFEALRRTMKILADAGQKVITATLNKDPWNHQCYDAYDDMIRWTLAADGTWHYDYTIFDRWVELMLSLGIDGMINCYSMVPWNNELVYNDEASGSPVTVKAEPGTPEFERMWTPFLKDFKQHLAAKGWLEKTNIAMDERSPEAMDAAVKVLEKCAPEMGFALADNHSSYKRYTMMRDVCVNINQKFDRADLDARRAEGYSTTFYVCCGPHFPNTFTYSNPWESELLGWYGLAAGFDGMLRWAYNSYPEDPAYDSRFSGFPSGDTYFVYPYARSSIRMEKLVEGIQNVEKVRLLREADPAKVKDIDAILAEMMTMNILDPQQPWLDITCRARKALDEASR